MATATPTAATEVAAAEPMDARTQDELIESLVGSYYDTLVPSFRLAPYSPDVFIATKGYKTLDDMLSMIAVRSPLNIIRDAVLYKGWRVVPAVLDQANGDYVQAALMANALEYTLDNIVDASDNGYSFRQDIFELLAAIHYGFRFAEIEWRVMESGPYAGKLGLAQLAHKPCQQIGFDLDARTLRVVGYTSYTPATGYQFGVPPEKALRYTFAPKDSLPYGNGLGRAVYKHSWSLDFLYRFWNIALEQYGSPFILANAPANLMNLAAKCLQRIRQGAPAILPDGVEASLKEITGAGIAGFKAAAEHHTQQIAKGYLGATLTSGEGQRVGSMALGKVHQDTQEYNLSGRRVDIEDVINYGLVRRWVRYNWGDAALALAPKFSLGVWDTGDMLQTAQAFAALITSEVMHPAEDQIRERLGLTPIDADLRTQMEKLWDGIGAPPPVITPPPSNGDGTGDGGGDGTGGDVGDNSGDR